MAFYFNLPLITDLTLSQQSILNETRPIALSGGPGTGKSVVSLWRHIRNYSANIRTSLLLTYTKSLTYYLKNSCNNNPTAATHVHSAWRWIVNANNQRYGEIIIDEAQDLGEGQFGDIFFDLINNYSDMISYGADDSQMLYQPPQGTTEQGLKNRYSNNVQTVLGENFRNTLEIMLIARELFPSANIPNTTIQILRDKNKRGPKPILQKCNDFDEQKKGIIDIIREFTSDVHNIAILLPNTGLVNSYYNYIVQYYPNATKYTTHLNNCIIDNIHVTTFHSAKGLEFDTVIIPNFELFTPNKEYFVGITRAKTNLYFLSNNNHNNIRQDICDKFIYNANLNTNSVEQNDDLPF